MKITFPYKVMDELFLLANERNLSPAKLTVLAVQEFIINNKEDTKSDSKDKTNYSD